MSWAEEDWTVGLSGRVLQKVKELQVQQERLSRENKQKQLQLDNIHTSLEKQTVKYDEVRGELQSVHRELQSVQAEAKGAITSRDRLTQELQTKQAQVCSVEGQLDAARTLNNKLTQEVKRLEAELEKLQNSSRSADTTLFSTPCWSTTSPWEHNGSRNEERQGHRDEGQSRAPHIRQRLQFSEVATASLPRQQHKGTPHRHPSDQSDSFSTPMAAFPWERDDSRPAARRRSPPSPMTPSADVASQGQLEQGVCGKEKDYRAETDALRSRVSALQEELNAKATSLKSIQTEMTQSKKELAAREVSIQRTRDELSLAHTRMAQESERASGAEQRLKQLQEELKCQRQNAESSRLQHQQRLKELEKQHQRDLTELQKERQCLEKQHQQEVNKLNQELQQARTLHNALQAQADKLSLQKQALDKELESLKEKLKWTEGQLQESKKKEAQTQAKLTEAVREAEGAAVSLEQSRKKERALEEEGRRLAEERADALRLLKELQEQKSAPAPLVQPVQFCTVGQSAPAQSSYSLTSRTPAHIKRSTTAEQKREEDVEKRRLEISASYPSDREPGEGIDSEHITVMISPDSESLQRGGRRKSNEEEENKSRNESDSCGMNKRSTFDPVLSSSSHSVDDAPTNAPPEKASSLRSEQANPSEELKRENAALRSELQDAREELQKRLEDLESQRRAEAEARTRLKQLSRKHASQSVEKQEQEKGWKAQLESEKAETEKLRKALAALETETKRQREKREKIEREDQEEDNNKDLEDRESELIELNIQLKKQLTEVKSQLALEREEREREAEERNQMTNTDMDVKKELSMELEELKAELEELKRSRKADTPEEEKLPVANSPLTYLTLHDDELNSNMVHCDNEVLPSPEQHLLFCQSTNQRNMLVSQATADLIQEERTVIDPEVAPELEDTRQNYLVGSSLSDNRNTLFAVQKDEPAVSDLAKEVKRLQKESKKEADRANQYQVKLEALQNQVTRQTQQLTMAFEKQSQHISGLLVELQEKESALLCQGEELQRCKQALEALEAQKHGEKMTIKEAEDAEQKEKSQGDSAEMISGLQPNQEKDRAATATATASPAQRDASQPDIVTSNAEKPTPVSVDEALVPVEQLTDETHSQNKNTADVLAELLALRRENQLLKQKILASTTSDAPVLHTESENNEDPVIQTQSAGNGAPPRVTAEEQSSLQNAQTSEDGEREVGSTTGIEEAEEVVCQLHLKHLEQQVVELNMRVRALSQETQQQAEELSVWRLASQPPPTFDKNVEAQEEIATAPQSRSNQQQADGASHIQPATRSRTPHQGAEESSGHVTVIREDELLLSCSSNKLQGRMLFSRLQHSNLPEPKSLHTSKKTAPHQEYNQDIVKIDEDSEKENLEINLLHQSQQKERSDAEVIHMSSEKTGQQHVTKDQHKFSGPKQTKTAEGTHEAKSDASKATGEVNTTDECSGRTEMKSVSSQTEESLYPPGAPTAPELHCVYTQTEEEEEEEEDEDEDEPVESPPVSPVPLSEDAQFGDKVLFSGSFPIPADPARLAERIRRNRTQLSAAFDDTEYEPYGLPEVVMKGFADIPSGPSCPYIVRRGLLGTTVVPAAQTAPGQEEETD